MSEKHDNFVRLAQARLDKLLKQFELLENLTRAQYEHSVQESDEIVEVINRAFEKLQVKFSKTAIEEKSEVQSKAPEEVKEEIGKAVKSKKQKITSKKAEEEPEEEDDSEEDDSEEEDFNEDDLEDLEDLD